MAMTTRFSEEPAEKAHRIDPVSKVITTGKDSVTLLRDAALLFMAVLLVVWPQTFNAILVKAGFEEGSFAGLKWKAKLSETDKALVGAQATIADFREQNKKLNQALTEATPQLNSADLKAHIASLEKVNAQLSANSSKVQASVESTLSNNASYVQQAQLATGGKATWGVVFAGDANLDSAKYEVQVAGPHLGITNAAVYYRQGSYRSVATTPDRLQAEQLLQNAKERRSDSYIVNMANWCPGKTERAGYFECANP